MDVKRLPGSRIRRTFVTHLERTSFAIRHSHYNLTLGHISASRHYDRRVADRHRPGT